MLYTGCLRINILKVSSGHFQQNEIQSFFTEWKAVCRLKTLKLGCYEMPGGLSLQRRITNIYMLTQARGQNNISPRAPARGGYIFIKHRGLGGLESYRKVLPTRRGGYGLYSFAGSALAGWTGSLV